MRSTELVSRKEMLHPMLTPPSEVTSEQARILKRGSDILATVSVNLNLNEPAESVARAASKLTPELPQYRPDGAGVILVFHTESGCQVLGGVRENPALQGETTSQGSAFPLQMTTTLGGRVTAPERSVKELVVEAARGRILPRAPVDENHESQAALQGLTSLCNAIASPEGWEAQVCIHTDKWANKDGSESTMCYLTAVKHLRSSDAQLDELAKALASSMEIKRMQGEDTRTLMSFRFARLDALVSNACATYSLDEKSKAERAWEQFGTEVVVTFNDLAVATLATHGALIKEHQAALI